MKHWWKLKYNYIICVFTFLAFPPSPKFPQPNYKTEIFTTKNGLSHDCVRNIYQDAKGFIWIGTEGGLNKYDGYNFNEYLSKSDYSTFSNQWIGFIYEDISDNGNFLWFGTSEGVQKLDRKTSKLSFYNINKLDTINNRKMWASSICKVNDTEYLIGGNGLKYFNEKTQKTINYLEEFEELFVYSIYKRKQGEFWIGTNFGLFEFSSTLKKVTGDYKNLLPESIHVLSFYEEDNGNVWIGSDLGLYLFIRNQKIFIRPKFKVGNSLGKIIHSIFEDSKGNLFAASNNSILSISQSRDSITIVKQLLDKISSPYSRGNNRPYNQNVISAFIDKSDIIWIGTGCNGIYKLIPNRKKFKLYRHNPNDNYSLGSSMVTSFCEDNEGNIYIGTVGGNLNQFNRITEKFLRIDLSVDNYSVKQGANNDIWYSNYYSLINFNVSNNMSTAYFGNGISNTLKFSISQNNNANDALRLRIWDSLFANFDLSQIKTYPNIKHLYVDKQGTVWCVITKGNENFNILHTFNLANKEFNPVEILTDERVSNFITHIYEDNKGIMWFGTEGKGLIKRLKINNGQYKFIQYKHEELKANTISNNNITVITEDNKGYLWIGTNKGLNKLDTKHGIFERYGYVDGLKSEFIAGILVDDQETLWISTNKGLSKFDTKIEKFFNYNVEDGLQGNNYSIGSYYKSNVGELYFGGSNGFNMFKPENIQENPFPPDVIINRFTIINEEVKPGINSPLKISIELAREVILDYDQDIFTLEFAALDYTNPAKNLFAYKLEGVHSDWIYTDSERRFATFTNLNPGSYNFTVKAANNDGIWSDKTTQLLIIITPPWWQTSWAYIGYTLFALLILYITWVMQMRRIKIKHELSMKEFETEKLREVDLMKSNFFANISHEFRTPLTLIKGPVEGLLNEERSAQRKEIFQTILRNSKNLLNLINELLDLSKLEAGKMKLCAGKYDIVSFTKGIIMSFNSKAEAKEISLSVTSTRNYIELYFDKEKMQKIISNIVSNAIKFTPEKGKVTVDIQECFSDNNLSLIIRDTGVGVPKGELSKLFNRFYQVIQDGSHQNSGTGIGLALTKELVQMHKGTITVKSEPNNWTEFTLTFPLGKKHLKDDEIIINDNDDFVYTSIDVINIQEETNKDRAKILIVEDNKDVLNYIKDILGKEYTPILALNGEEGLEKAKSIIPDLIISDIMMPLMDGNLMCKMIKKDEKTSHIPIILLTAKADENDKIDGLETGADDYIIKPFDPVELIVRIKNLINQRKKLRSKYLKEAEIHPVEVAVTSIDKLFIKKATKYLEQNITNESLSVENMAEHLNMSRTQLYRKFCGVLGEKPNDFIRKYRLRKAAELLKGKFGNIAQVAYEVGFSDPAYFSKCFKKLYKVNPHDYNNKVKIINKLKADK